MASNGSRGGLRSQSRSRISSSVPVKSHFAQVMNAETVELGMLCIPTTFSSNYGDYLSSSVRLKVFNGETSLVKLKRRVGKQWLGRGWGAFVLKYGISEGYTVLFKYEGSSEFHVVILDGSSNEIEYSSKAGSPEKVGEARKRARPQESKESIISIGCSSGEESGDELPRVPSNKATRAPRREAARCNGIKDERSGPHKKNPKPLKSKVKRRGVTRNSTLRFVGGVQRWGGCRNPSRQFQIANRFITEHPSYQVQMQKTYMKSGGLSICRNFMKKTGLLQEENVVLLKKPGSDRWSWWPVKLLMYGELQRGKFCSGWKKFVLDNSLKAGDVIIFELVETNAFHVHFFKGPPEQSASSSETSFTE